MDRDSEDYLVHLLLQNYGDLLKVSRSRGITLTLPQLRKAISKSGYIQSGYNEALRSEVAGMGLEEDALSQPKVRRWQKATTETTPILLTR